MRITKYSLGMTPEKTNMLIKESATNYASCDNLTNPWKIADMMRSVFNLGNMAEEYFYVLALNAKCKAIGIFEISHGEATFSYVDPKAIFSRLLLCGGPIWIAVHNHPSGDCTPSKADIELTDRLYKGGKLLNIQLVDHVIVSDEQFFSFREHDMLKLNEQEGELL